MPNHSLSKKGARTVPVNTRWPVDLLALVDEYAARLEISRSEAIRRAMAETIAVDTMCPAVAEMYGGGEKDDASG